MAKYDFSSAPLIEAGEAFRLLAGSLDAIRERLGGVRSDLTGNMPGIGRRISAELEAIADLRLSADKAGRTLLEIVEIYARAEQAAFGGFDEIGPAGGAAFGGFGQTGRTGQRQTMKPGSATPVIRRTHGVFLSDALILPDWLQAAVLKYEQTKREKR